MNNSFSSQQISKNANLDSNLKNPQCKLNLRARFMQIKIENPKLKQCEIADQLDYSSTTLQRYRNDKIMLSFYKIQPSVTKKRSEKVSNTTFDNNSHPENDLKRHQMTSSDLK